MTHIDLNDKYWSTAPLDEWGPAWWKEAEEWAEKIPCPECREFGVRFINFGHDLVNLHKGEQLERPEDFFWVYDHAEEMVKACKLDGHCIPHKPHTEGSERHYQLNDGNVPHEEVA